MAVKRVQVLQKNLELLVDRVSERELLRRAQNVADIAKSLAPRADGSKSFHSGPDRLADNIKVGITTQRGKKVVRIFTDAKNSRGQEYARFIIRGTRPHAIVGNPNLAFQWIKNNVFVITPRVNHPGTHPNNFLLEALRRGFNK